MLSGGAMATDSLLPDNPAARIMPVQGGGAMPKSDALLSGNRKPAGWHSTPVIVPVSANSVEELNSSPLTLKTYKDRWRRTLGPNVPSRHRPRQDPYIVIGSLDITTCPTYVVAPLRGDIDAAKDTLFWTNQLLKDDSKAHVVFMGPLTEGGSRADGDLILKILESLMSSYPGHVMYVSDSRGKDISQLPGSLDGLVLYAMPHTSKQIVFGFIPDQDEVYSSSVRTLDCLEVETVRIPADAMTKRKEGERMLTIQFSKAKSSYNRTKQPRSQLVRDNRKWNAPPGWVSQISYQTKDGSMASQPVQEGGNPTSENANANAGDGINVKLGGSVYKVRDPNEALQKWQDGEFTAEEQRLLEENNLKFTNEVYAIFLKGLFNSKCKTLSGAESDPECGGFRYLMSLAYFNKEAQAQGNEPLSVNVNKDEGESTHTTSASSAASASAASAGKSAIRGAATSASAATAPSAGKSVSSAPAPAPAPTASKDNVLDITFSSPGKPDDKYGVSKGFTQVLVGRNPEDTYNSYKAINPSLKNISIVNPHFVELKELDTYSGISRLQFGLIRKDSVWHIINLSETNKIIGPSPDKKQIKTWDLKKTPNTFDGVEELDQIGDNIFSIGLVTIKIKINTVVDNTLNSPRPSSTATPALTPTADSAPKTPTGQQVRFANNSTAASAGTVKTPVTAAASTAPTPAPTSGNVAPASELGSLTNATGRRTSARAKNPSKVGESRVAKAYSKASEEKAAKPKGFQARNTTKRKKTKGQA